VSDPIEYKGQATSNLYCIHAVGHTDVGREREINEDSLFVDAKLDLFLVCDGMGGHTSGQLASKTAVQAVVESVASSKRESMLDALVDSLHAANQAVYTHAEEHLEFHGMGTTGVAIFIDGSNVHVAHVGDSRLYRLRGPSFQQLTRDHSLCNLYADKPELQGKLGPATSNVIVRAIGLEPQITVEHRTIALEEDDLFLLCSDGLSDLVDDKEIYRIIQSDAPLDVMSRQLINLANDNGGTDNVTVVLVKVLSIAGEMSFDGKTTYGF